MTAYCAGVILRAYKRAKDGELMGDQVDASELFEDVFCGVRGGSPVVECGCGRTVYSDSPYYDEGERERLDASADLDSKRVIYQDCDSVSHCQLAGRTFVLGCPCGGLAKLERLIWTHRDELSVYLRRRTDAQIAELQKTRDHLGPAHT